MLRLTNPDLPDIPSPPPRSAPTFRLYRDESRILPFLFRFDRFANYRNTPFQQVSSTLLIPDYGGYLLRLSPGFLWNSIVQVAIGGTTYGILDNPLEARPQTVWLDAETGSINVYAPTFEGVATIDLTVATPIPNPINGHYIFTIPAGLTLTAVTASGVRLDTAEWSQDGTTLTVQPASLRLAPGATAILQGTVTLSVPDPIAIALTFDLSNSAPALIDGLDYLGFAYIPSPVPVRPHLHEFFWRSPLLTLFADAASAERLLLLIRPRTGQSTTGTISYTSYS